MSLYRRSRPLTFGDMTGQEHVTRTLSNALSRGSLAHAYLFCGPRGTGKTTAAKILARAVNCRNYPGPEPCGNCTPCKNIAAGVSIDVIEMDAASNRGIDEIRELRERTRYASGESRYKVYIIDEAHMLTTEACNAFLKTLEEPPRGVIFILATTDPSRLPSTIVSRCQRFDFHLLTAVQIKQRMEQVLEREGWSADQEALQLIARLADGSLRDALGILEQCRAYGEDSIIAEHVRTVTGATRVETIGALIGAAVTNDLDSGLSAMEQIFYSGRDLNLFMRDLIFVFSRLLLSSGAAIKNKAGSLYGFEELLENYHGKLSRQTLLDAVELLHEVNGELRHAHFPQFILEVAFIRLLRVLHGRVQPVAASKQESVNTHGHATVVCKEEQKAATLPLAYISTSEKMEKMPEATAKIGATSPTDETFSQLEGRLAKLQGSWPRLIQEVKKKQKSTAAWLEPAILSECRENMVVLSYPKDYFIHQQRIMEEGHRKLTEEIISLFLRRPATIKAVLAEEEVGPIKTSGKEHVAIDGVKKAVGSADALKIFSGELIDAEREEV
ncbi:MAG TPA: DNA polymerase III subunit gamma/tau [Candidatus Limnocylindrales bacterium]|nr:DNA polymerase III subunit gamma/tau [Candidatus Limnocylindrales bacterium]